MEHTVKEAFCIDCKTPILANTQFIRCAVCERKFEVAKIQLEIRKQEIQERVDRAEAEDKELEHLKPALKKQVGGNHYKDMKIQVVEFCHANKLDYMQGAAIKYICRFRDKKGIEDLMKAKHYIEMLIELEYGNSDSGTH